MKINHQKTAKQKRTMRVRAKVRGTTLRPRLSIDRSNKFTYLQVIDDEQGKTIAAARSLADAKTTKTEEAKRAATELAKKIHAANITKLVFDRGAYRYHGRVRVVADVMREQGLEV